MVPLLIRNQVVSMITWNFHTGLKAGNQPSQYAGQIENPHPEYAIFMLLLAKYDVIPSKMHILSSKQIGIHFTVTNTVQATEQERQEGKRRAGASASVRRENVTLREEVGERVRSDLCGNAQNYLFFAVTGERTRPQSPTHASVVCYILHRPLALRCLVVQKKKF